MSCTLNNGGEVEIGTEYRFEAALKPAYDAYEATAVFSIKPSECNQPVLLELRVCGVCAECEEQDSDTTPANLYVYDGPPSALAIE